jgi:hypothetical protein
MLKRIWKGSSDETIFTEFAKESNGSHNGLSTPGNGERKQTDLPGMTALSSFDEIYRRSALNAATSTVTWDIFKVADMVNNGHLQGLSPAAKHSALMMALETAGVSVEDMLHDAAERQRVLHEYEEGRRKRLEDFQTAKQLEKERLSAAMEVMCAEYRMRIADTEQDVERERGLFREWQERKEKEQRRISEAASACASVDVGGTSDHSSPRLIEKNSARQRESVTA